MITITEITCDSSHWGSSWTSRPEPPDDHATDGTAVGARDDALVHDVGDVQSLLSDRRPACRADRPGFAGGARRHRLVLEVKPLGTPARTRPCEVRGDGAGLFTPNPTR